MLQPTRGEERGVDEEVELGVEVAPEHGDPAREAGELPVGVVEHRLQLEEQRGERASAAAELDGSREARRTRRGDDEPAAARAGAASASTTRCASGRKTRSHRSSSRASACATGAGR